MWLWLAQRFDPAKFPGREAAEELSADLIMQMDEALLRMYANPSKEDEAVGRRHHRKTSDIVKVRTCWCRSLAAQSEAACLQPCL